MEPDGLWRMVRDIRNVEKALGKHYVYVPDEVSSFRRKLGRSLAIKVDIKRGEEFTEDMFYMTSPGNGLTWDDREKFIGKKAKKKIEAFSLIDSSCI